MKDDIGTENIISIFNEIFDRDPMVKSSQDFKSNHLRRKFYKSKFDFVKPETIPINEEEKTNFAYVPVIKTLSLVSKDKSI